MKFLAGESVHRYIVDRLPHDGRLVKYVAELASGISDEIVLEWANIEVSIPLTADKDFGELVFRQRSVNSTGYFYARGENVQKDGCCTGNLGSGAGLERRRPG